MYAMGAIPCESQILFQENKSLITFSASWKNGFVTKLAHNWHSQSLKCYLKWLLNNTSGWKRPIAWRKTSLRDTSLTTAGMTKCRQNLPVILVNWYRNQWYPLVQESGISRSPYLICFWLHPNWHHFQYPQKWRTGHEIQGYLPIPEGIIWPILRHFLTIIHVKSCQIFRKDPYISIINPFGA